MASTFVLKRKFYNTNTSNFENAGDVVGGNAGALVGTGTGAAIGAAGAGLVGAGIGARSGWKKAAENNKLINNAQFTKDAADGAYKNMMHAASGTNTQAQAALRSTYDKATAAATDAAKKAEGLKKMSKGGTALKKASKFGGIALLGGAIAGGLMGNSAGKSTGQAVGAAAGGAVGSGVDRLTRQQ